MATGTGVLTSTLDKRTDTLNKFIVWERVLTFSFVSGQADATTLTVPINGILQTLHAKRSGAGGAAVTATVAINDNNDNAVFSQAGLAESGTSKFSMSEPLAGKIDFVVTPNTDPLSAYTVTLYLRGI